MEEGKKCSGFGARAPQEDGDKHDGRCSGGYDFHPTGKGGSLDAALP